MVDEDSSTEKSGRVTVTRREVGLLLSGGVIGSGLTASVLRGGDEPQQDSVEAETGQVQLRQRPFLGHEDGEVTIVYYVDFQCPFCKQFEDGALQRINEEYVGEDIRLVIKPISVFGPDSDRAAISSHCVWEQVQDSHEYWSWHTAVMNLFDERNSGWAAAEELVSLATDHEEIDGEHLQSCVEEEEYDVRLVDDFFEGEEFGLDATPYFVVFGDDASDYRTLSGAQPYSLFKTIIENYR